VLALAMAIVAAADVSVSAHRRDEYLQAARLGIDPGRVGIELDLTPGIALADAIIAEIDRDRDGTLSSDEQRDYATRVVRELELGVDGRSLPLSLDLDAATFPDVDSMRRGEGAIRLEAAATLSDVSTGTDQIGAHELMFRNGHHPDRSVYLANALVPASDRVAVTAQRRDVDQRELIIDYVVSPAPATSTAAWLFAGIAAAAAVASVLVVSMRYRVSRSAH
jgi:hypothetical protein